MIIIGLGIGVSFSVLNISTLDSVPPQYKSSASSLITFFRTVGPALGITVFGAMHKHEFQSALSEMSSIDSQIVTQIKGGQALLDPVVQAKMGLSEDIVQDLLFKLADSIIFIFQWSVILPAAALIFALLMGRARLETAESGHLVTSISQGTQSDNPIRPETSLHHVHEAVYSVTIVGLKNFDINGGIRFEDNSHWFHESDRPSYSRTRS